MTQIVLTFTLFVIALTLLVTALIVLRLQGIANRAPLTQTVEKHLAYQWLPMLGAILRAAGNFLRAANRRQIHDRKRKTKSDSDRTKQDPE